MNLIIINSKVTEQMNKHRIKLTSFPENWDIGMTKYILPKHLRKARKIGDIEIVNNTQLAWLNEQGFGYIKLND